MANGTVGRRVYGRKEPGRDHKDNGSQRLPGHGPVTVDSIQMNTRAHPYQPNVDQDLTFLHDKERHHKAQG
eukprot:487362-Prorocentrum_lima.AAC.1